MKTKRSNLLIGLALMAGLWGSWQWCARRIQPLDPAAKWEDLRPDLSGLEGVASEIQFSADSTLLVGAIPSDLMMGHGYAAPATAVWRVDNRRLLFYQEKSGGAPPVFSPSGQYLALGAPEMPWGKIDIWNLKSGEIAASIECEHHAAPYFQDEETLVTQGDVLQAWKWREEKALPASALRATEKPLPPAFANEWRNAQSQGLFDSEAKRCLAISGDRKVWIKTQVQYELATIPGLKNRKVPRTTGTVMEAIDTQTNKSLWKQTVPYRINGVAFKGQDRIIVAGADSLKNYRSCCVTWEAKTGKFLGSWNAGRNSEVSPDGRLVAVGVKGGVKLWDTSALTAAPSEGP